jgi:hypothetical protein
MNSEVHAGALDHIECQGACRPNSLSTDQYSIHLP